nr:uncharacterized protein LOC104085760 [Nicotiana tomentosiformis]
MVATIRKLIVNIKPKDISSIISGSPGEDPKMLAHFKDLMERIFVLDPDKRITVSQALSHPFITVHWSLAWLKLQRRLLTVGDLYLGSSFFQWNIFFSIDIYQGFEARFIDLDA